MFRLIIASILATFALNISAQPTAREVFQSSDTSMLPTISQSLRLDMVDYYDSGANRPVKDAFDAECIIDTITDNVLSLTIDGKNRFDLVVLPSSKADVIMCIQSLATPAIDSDLMFYSNRHSPISVEDFIKLPLLEDWLTPAGKKQRIAVENALDFMTYKATYNEATNTLVFTPTIDNIVAEENAKLIAESIRPSLTYVWNGSKFKKQP